LRQLVVGCTAGQGASDHGGQQADKHQGGN
jgi:hypothetical protein